MIIVYLAVLLCQPQKKENSVDVVIPLLQDTRLSMDDIVHVYREIKKVFKEPLKAL
jgi:hypothetical protein